MNIKSSVFRIHGGGINLQSKQIYIEQVVKSSRDIKKGKKEAENIRIPHVSCNLFSVHSFIQSVNQPSLY